MEILHPHFGHLGYRDAADHGIQPLDGGADRSDRVLPMDLSTYPVEIHAVDSRHRHRGADARLRDCGVRFRPSGKTDARTLQARNNVGIPY